MSLPRTEDSATLRIAPDGRCRVHSSNIPAVLIALCCMSPLHAAEDQPRYGMFGQLHLARPSGVPSDVILLLSDGDGWNARQQSFAGTLAQRRALVVGIDLPSYLTRLAAIGDSCSYPSGHFEELAHWIERHEGIADYRTPLVLGDGSGATFAYAMVAQAPAGTFSGLITLGWDWNMRLSQPICAGDAGAMTQADSVHEFRVVPVDRLPTRWLPRPFAPAARNDGSAATIARAWHLATLLVPMLPQAAPAADLGHAYAGWKTREQAQASSLPGDIADLPLTEVTPARTDSDRIAIMLTGDGGWAGLDKGVAEALAADGVRVIGFSTLKFFWEKRTPEQAAEALQRVLATYAKRYPQARFAVLGYSFGASLVPVLINRLPADLQSRIDGGIMISPDPDAVFEIKVGDWFGGAKHDGSVPVMPAITDSPVTITCIHGIDEKDSFCDSAQHSRLRVLTLPGGHHYDGNYTALGNLIVANMPKQ